MSYTSRTLPLVCCNAWIGALRSLVQIGDRPVNVSVVADDKSIVPQGDWQLCEPPEELSELVAQCHQPLWSAIDDYQLIAAKGGDPSSKEAAVVGLVILDPLMPSGHVVAVRLLGIVEPSIWGDPEDVIRVAMGEILDLAPSA